MPLLTVAINSPPTSSPLSSAVTCQGQAARRLRHLSPVTEHGAKWRVVFFGERLRSCALPRSRRSAENGKFEDRDAQILGVSIVSNSRISGGVHSAATKALRCSPTSSAEQPQVSSTPTVWPTA